MTTPGEEIANIEEAARYVSLSWDVPLDNQCSLFFNKPVFLVFQFIVFQQCLLFFQQQEVPLNLPCLVFESINEFLTYA